MGKIAPSILAADFGKLGDQLVQIERAGAEMLHIDVMDGVFVPNISIGFPVIHSIRSYTRMVFDVHMMVQTPENYIKMAVDAGADCITVHQESCPHLHRVICQIKEEGCRAGAALNPATPLHMLEYVVKDVDMVLLMTVNPGFGGRTFIPGMIEKIRECRELFASKNCSPLLELEGGITLENAEECIRAGADILVAGSPVFRNDIQANIQKFNRMLL